MNHIYCKSLLTGVIASLVAAPGWAVADSQQTVAAQDQQPGQTMRQQAPGTAIPSHGVYGKTPKELTRMDLRGTNGDALGTLKDVVAKREGGELCAVISVGGILGVGAREVVVPLDELYLRGDELHILASKDELMKREIYAATLYRDVQPADRPISEFSVFETRPEGSPNPGGSAD